MGILGGLGGIGNIASLALNSTGLGTIASMAAKNLVSALGQAFIQKVGDMLGLPQPLIDAAQGQYALASGDPAGALKNFQEAAQGFVQQAGGSLTDGANFGRELMDSITKGAADTAGGSDAQEAKASGKGGSWLMAMARALGAKADSLAGEMQTFADKMAANKSDPSASLEFSAKSQEFGLFMNAATNALKTAGESLTTAARKG